MHKLAIVTAIAAFILIGCDKSDSDQQAHSQTNSETVASAASSPTNAALLNLPPAQDNSAPLVEPKPTLSPQSTLQTDYSTIKQLAQAKQAEVLTINQEIIQASQNKDKEKLKVLFPKLSAVLTEFNQQLDSIDLHNSQVIALRDKMIEANHVSINLMQVSLSESVNADQLKSIFEKAALVQQDLLSLDLKIQNQFPALSSTPTQASNTANK